MKRLMALIGAILLVLLYVSTLVCVLINSPASMVLFKFSVSMTILVPVLIAGYQIVSNAFQARRDRSLRNSSKDTTKDETDQ